MIISITLTPAFKLAMRAILCVLGFTLFIAFCGAAVGAIGVLVLASFGLAISWHLVTFAAVIAGLGGLTHIGNHIARDWTGFKQAMA